MRNEKWEIVVSEPFSLFIFLSFRKCHCECNEAISFYLDIMS